jgi:hypothetical protein
MNFKEYFNLYLEAKTFANANALLMDPANREKYFPEILDDFSEAGGEFLGAGAGGSVYTHPDWPYVLKVFPHDHCYLRFLRYVMKHQNDPCLPKIYGGVKKIRPQYKRHWSHQTVYVVRLEKLQFIEETADFRFINMLLGGIIRPYNTYKREENIGGIASSRQEYENKLSQLKAKGKRAVMLWNTIKKIAALEVGGEDCRWDIHAGNVMIRPLDGNYVLIDPYYGAPIHKHPAQYYYTAAIQDTTHAAKQKQKNEPVEKKIEDKFIKGGERWPKKRYETFKQGDYDY